MMQMQLPLAIPDRLPSLVLLVGFWIPAAMVGWAAADLARRNTPRLRPPVTFALLAALVVGWSATWFVFQVHRMPPYIPGATADPTDAPPKAVAALAAVAAALVLPGSAIAAGLAFRIRRRSLHRAAAGPDARPVL